MKRRRKHRNNISTMTRYQFALDAAIKAGTYQKA
jgi:hypothetical protein